MSDAAWIFGTLVAIIWFAVFELLAFRHPDRFNTLSHFVFIIGSRWPLSIWIMGVFCGVLAAHFFWHWCPAGSISTGALFPFDPLSHFVLLENAK